MHEYEKHLSRITLGKEKRLEQLIHWSNQNSFSHNRSGLDAMQRLVKEAFSELKGEIHEIPSENLLTIAKRKNAPIQIILGGHLDTVYPPTSPFQRARWIDDKRLGGPGVADMKGGLMTLLLALLALEESPYASSIGWRVFLNSDEEIGSQKSGPRIAEFAQGCRLGLLFEPSFPDGSLAAARKGSLNLQVQAKGQSAHAGRDFHLGKNAITALCKWLVEAEKWTALDQGITVNIGRVEGGGALNIVPDHALAGINIRMENPNDLPLIKEKIEQSLKEAGNDCELTLHIQSERPPKPFDGKQRALFEQLKSSAEELYQPLFWKNTGGACDGNLLYEAGVPNIDSLGPIGGNIHTDQEYILADSLFERAELTALFLFKLANGDFS